MPELPAELPDRSVVLDRDGWAWQNIPQVAPTILEALGLDPNKLDAVQEEGTQVLPGLGLDSGKSRD